MHDGDIQSKLGILNKKTSELISEATKNPELASYIKKTREAISAAREAIQALGLKGSYHESFPVQAYSILSISPFTTKTHLCTAFRCNVSTINEWASEHEEFAKALEQGFYEGELLARDLLVQSAFEPSQKVNTNLLKILSNNVYSIQDSQDINLKATEPLKFQVEVVSADKDKNTG